MADDDVPFAEFQKFIAEIGLERDCDECGHNEWQVYTDAQDEAGPDMNSTRKLGVFSNSLGGFLPVFAMSCANCGIMKLVSSDAVTKWRGERGRS